MQRWVLISGSLVKGYLRTEGEPTDAQKRQLAFGDPEADTPLAEAGDWVLVPPELEAAGIFVGDDWTVSVSGTGERTYAPPVR